jgi:hypothetical protein
MSEHGSDTEEERTSRDRLGGAAAEGGGPVSEPQASEPTTTVPRSAGQPPKAAAQ